MKIEHVHNFEIAGFDLNFTITTVIIAAVSIDLKSFPPPTFIPASRQNHTFTKMKCIRNLIHFPKV